MQGERVGYLDQQLEARDPLERQDEEGGEGQPPALGVQLQLCNQLPEGCLLLAGHTDESVGLGLVRVCVLRCLTCVQLYVNPWTVARQAPLSMGILQARILEWVAMPSSRGSSPPRDGTRISYVSCIGRWVLYH